jgi:hypothetical protein
MKLELSSILNSASGSLGGSVFSVRKSGLCLNKKKRNHVRVNNPTQNAKARFTQIRLYWSSLSPTLKKAWNNLAESHNISSHKNSSLKLSGSELFVYLNSNRLRFGFALLAAPPILSPFVVPVSFTAVCVDNFSFHINFIPNPLPIGFYYVIYATQCLRYSKKPKLVDYKFIYILSNDTVFPTSLFTPYFSVFPAQKVVGYYIHLKCYLFNSYSGQISIPSIYSCLIQ